MKQQPSKKAMGFSAVLTGLILIGLVGVNLSRQGWSMALTNPVKIEQAQTADLASATLDGLDAQTAADQVAAPELALDPALEAALDAALDPDMDPALKESLKSALRSALAPQTVSASTGKQPPIVVTVEPIYMAGQQQIAASSGGQQWDGGGQAFAPAQQNDPAVDQVAAAYQAQLEQAYAALQDAYTQIDTLQTAPVATNISYQGDDDHGSEHEDGEREGGEHDDDHDGGDND